MSAPVNKLVGNSWTNHAYFKLDHPATKATESFIWKNHQLMERAKDIGNGVVLRFSDGMFILEGDACLDVEAAKRNLSDAATHIILSGQARALANLENANAWEKEVRWALDNSIHSHTATYRPLCVRLAGGKKKPAKKLPLPDELLKGVDFLLNGGLNGGNGSDGLSPRCSVLCNRHGYTMAHVERLEDGGGWTITAIDKQKWQASLRPIQLAIHSTICVMAANRSWERHDKDDVCKLCEWAMWMHMSPTGRAGMRKDNAGLSKKALAPFAPFAPIAPIAPIAPFAPIQA